MAQATRVACACAYCGATIWRTPHAVKRAKQPYCSPAHKIAHLKTQMLWVPCGHCGEPTQVKSSRRVRAEQGGTVYCSRSCYHDLIAAQVDVQCAVCGNPVRRYQSKQHRSVTGQAFCSTDCWVQGKRRPRRPRATLTCQNCGENYQVLPSRAHRSKYCRFDCKRRQITKTCGWYERDFCVSASRQQAARYCSRDCYRLVRYKAAIPGQWHNGRPKVLHTNGYVKVYQPGHPEANKAGWMMEHRLIAELTLGRCLEPGEQVNHANEIKTDNRPENLHVVTIQQHQAITAANAKRRRARERAELAEYHRRFGPLGEEQVSA